METGLKENTVSKRKTGIYSGSFNPVHIGHLALANWLCEFTELDELWFLITPHNPLKEKEELMDDYSGSDLFFFPTWEETEGIVMLEAMAMQTPVLVRDIPVYEGWLEHGSTVYKGKRREDFEQLLPAILEKQLPDLTQEAYQLVRENSITKIGTALAEIYDSLFEEGTYENINYNRLV